jgi:hypothetical protein
MEYADILERHRVLFGEPPFEGIRVDHKDLRLQLEQESMGKLLRLRQGVLASGNDPQRQLELLAASLSTFLVIFRAFERLHGTKPAADNVALATDVARRADFDPGPIVRVIRHVRDEQPLKAPDVPDVLAGYLRAMSRLVAHLDQYHEPQ